MEAAAEVRSRFHVPVVFLTAYSNREVLDRAKVTEPYGYVLKPYEERELHVVIETALYKHKMERGLHERERWFAAVLHSIGDGVATTDGGGRITYLNPVAEAMTGWPAGQAAGQALEDVFTLVNEDSRRPVENPLRRAMRERACVPLENHTVLIARGGNERPVEDSATPIMGGEEPLGGVMVFRDVSDRKRAEEAVREAEERFRATFEQAAVGIAHVSPDGGWLRVNQKLCSIVGYGGDELLGMTFQDITHPDDLDADLGQVRRVLAGEIPTYSMEKRYVRKDGSLVWIDLTVSLVRRASGDPDYFISVVEDITERKRAEAVQEGQRRTLELMVGGGAAAGGAGGDLPGHRGAGRRGRDRHRLAAGRGRRASAARSRSPVARRLDPGHRPPAHRTLRRLLRHRRPPGRDGGRLGHRRRPLVGRLPWPRTGVRAACLLVHPDPLLRRPGAGHLRRLPPPAARAQRAGPAAGRHPDPHGQPRRRGAAAAGGPAAQRTAPPARLRGGQRRHLGLELGGGPVGLERRRAGLFGYAADQVNPGAGWWYDRIHPDDRGRVVGGIHAAIDGGQELWQDEYRFRRADGSYADVFDRGRVVREGGRPVRMVGSMTDLTERKRAEQSLRDRERRLRAIIGTTPGCIKLVAPDGTLVEMNESGLRMVEADAAEAVVGKPVFPLIAPGDREQFRAFHEAVCRGQDGSLEFEVVGLRGSPPGRNLRRAVPNSRGVLARPWPSRTTSRSGSGSRSSSGRRRRWRRSASWPAAWPTTSTTC